MKRITYQYHLNDFKGAPNEEWMLVSRGTSQGPAGLFLDGNYLGEFPGGHQLWLICDDQGDVVAYEFRPGY